MLRNILNQNKSKQGFDGLCRRHKLCEDSISWKLVGDCRSPNEGVLRWYGTSSVVQAVLQTGKITPDAGGRENTA